MLSAIGLYVLIGLFITLVYDVTHRGNVMRVPDGALVWVCWPLVVGIYAVLACVYLMTLLVDLGVRSITHHRK